MRLPPLLFLGVEGLALLAFGFSYSCTSDAPTTRPSDGGSGQVGREDARANNDGGGVNDSGLDGGGPAGRLLLFVGSSDGKVRVYDVDETTGALSFKKESVAGTNPSFLAFDPGRRRVVAVDESGGGQVRSFDLDPMTGGLREINAKPAGGGGSTHLSLDPSGRWVLVANYGGGNASILPLAATGELGDPTDTKASGEKSHWAGTNPSGTHVFVPALGANVVAQYTLDAGSGKLAENGTAALPAGAGPRHLVFHPNESWAWVINELAVTVTTFDFERSTGRLTTKQTLSALPAGQATGGVSGAEIAVHPSGKHVYASTRGFNSIAHFTVDETSGRLTLAANTPTGGNQPRSFGITPEGTFLYAGNQSVGQVVGFRISPSTGGLETIGASLTIPSPTFVGVARVP